MSGAVEVCWLKFKKMKLFIPPTESLPFKAVRFYLFIFIVLKEPTVLLQRSHSFAFQTEGCKARRKPDSQSRAKEASGPSASRQF